LNNQTAYSLARQQKKAEKISRDSVAASKNNDEAVGASTAHRFVDRSQI
jgi:hypothetical protein